MDGLLGRSALAIDRDAGDVIGESGAQPTRSCDVPGLGTDRVAASEDHVFDRARIEICSVGQSFDDMRAEVCRMNTG